MMEEVRFYFFLESLNDRLFEVRFRFVPMEMALHDEGLHMATKALSKPRLARLHQVLSGYIQGGDLPGLVHR